MSHIVTQLVGVTNQVVVSQPGGVITLSLATNLVSINSITASAATDLGLNAGSGNQNVVLTPTGTGFNYIPSPFNLQIGSTASFWRTNNFGLAVISATGGGTPGAVNSAVFGSSGSALGVIIGYVGAASTSGQYGTIAAGVVGTSAATLLINPSGGNVLIGGTNTATDISGGGGLKVFGSTASTSTTSGAFQVIGGVGIGGSLFPGLIDMGANTTSAHAVQWSSDTQLYRSASGVLILSGGSTTTSIQFAPSGSVTAQLACVTNTFLDYQGSMVFRAGIAGSTALTITSGLIATFAGATASTSTTTGTVVVTGGVGIGGAVFAGGNITATTASNTLIKALNTDTQAAFIQMQALAGTNNSFISTNWGTGNGMLLFGVGTQTPGSAQMSIDQAGQIKALAATASTSTTTGALVVSGGLGLAGNLNLGGNIQGSQSARFTGQDFTNAAGAGAEIYYNGGAWFQGFNRTASSYQPVNVNGSTVALIISGIAALSINASSNATFAASVSIVSNLTVTGTITNASDSRLKTDIVDSDLGLSFILGLRPVAYTLRATPKSGRHYGLIAQELLSSMGTGAAAVSLDPTTDRYGIAYSQLIAPLIKGEQELHAQIVALKARVAELEGKA